MELFEFKYEEGFSSNRILLYVILAVLALVSIIVKTLGRDPIHVKFASLLKGPTPIPIFGNSLQYLAAGTEAPTKLMSDWRKKYGSIYRLWFANNLYVVVSDVDYIKDIIDHKNAKFHGPSFSAFWNYLSGSDTAEKDIWKTARGLQSHFSSSTVKTLVPQMNKITDQLLDYLQAKSGSEFDIYDTILDFTLDIFTSTEFDYVMDSATKVRFDVHSRSKKAIKIALGLSIFFPGMNSKFAQLLINNIFVAPLRKNFHRYLRMMTGSKISSIRNDIEKSTNLDHHKLSYLWTLYRKNNLVSNTNDKKPKNNELKIDTSGSFLLTSVESTCDVISFALLMIAMHGSVQDKLYREIHDVFGDDQRQMNYEDIERLSYMDQVVNETMRRHIHPFIVRYASEDTRLGPYILPKGTYVMIDTNAVHLDEQLYPRPLEFNPDNFNKEIVAKRSPFSLLTFSGGPRQCIGRTYSLTEIKLALAKIVRRFIIRTPLQMGDIKYITTLATKSANGYPISFVLRE